MSAFPVRGLRWEPKRANQLKKPQISFRRSAAYRQKAPRALAPSRVGNERFALPDAPIGRRAGQVRRKWKFEASSAPREEQDRAVRRIHAGK